MIGSSDSCALAPAVAPAALASHEAAHRADAAAHDTEPPSGGGGGANTMCWRVVLVAAFGWMAACADGGAEGALADAGSGASDAVADAPRGDAAPTADVPRGGLRVARATAIPTCTLHVDAAQAGAADGSAKSPHPTITAAITAAPSGAVICVAEGTYPEKLAPGTKSLTLAGGFRSGQGFQDRDSALYVSRALGDGTGAFFEVRDEAPTGDQRTVIDGFEITGYAQGVVRVHWASQRFDLTNNHIHGNHCAPGLVGGGFALSNVSGAIRGNVIAGNSCGRGGGGALDDGTASNEVTVADNWIDANAGDEPQTSHGGGLYLFCADLTVTGNLFTDNTVTAWGAGLYVGAMVGQGQHTTARLSGNVYRGNRAEVAGGGFFCDDAATCIASHEIYDSNCGGNVYLDAGSDPAAPTVSTFDHVTIYGALAAGCGAPGPGVQIDQANAAPDSHTFTNAIFWGNAEGADLSTSCQAASCPAEVTVTWSDVQSATVDNGITVTFGAGNLPGVDPLFVDAAAHDFRLLPGSPALGAAEDGSDLGAHGGAP